MNRFCGRIKIWKRLNLYSNNKYRVRLNITLIEKFIYIWDLEECLSSNIRIKRDSGNNLCEYK